MQARERTTMDETWVTPDCFVLETIHTSAMRIKFVPYSST